MLLKEGGPDSLRRERDVHHFIHCHLPEAARTTYSAKVERLQAAWYNHECDFQRVRAAFERASGPGGAGSAAP